MTTTEDPTTTDATARGGLRLPKPGEPGSIDDERAQRKTKLAGALRIFGRFGFSEGVAGHITARDPEHLDRFWVNPFGRSFNRMRVSDLICVDETGAVVEGEGSVNDAAFAIHAAIHAARPDVVAAAHSHATYSRAFSTLGKLLDPLTQDSCAFYGDHALHPDFGGVVADIDYGRALADTLGPHKAVLHQNHGAVTVGASVDEAVWWFVTLERSCQVQLLAEAAGEPKLIGHDAAALTATQVGTSVAGWFQFQPLWEDVVAEQPDFMN